MQISNIDNSNHFDWGKTSTDYSKYRLGYPASFFDLLNSLGVGKNNQRILDLGTGTGVLARAFAKRGANVTGVDISPEQINAAKELSIQEKVNVNFIVSKSEDILFNANTFGIVSAGQAWIYFNHEILIPKLKIIAPHGKLVLTHLSWLPYQDKIAEATEKLVLQYNPNWKGAGYKKAEPQMFGNLTGLELLTFHRYNVPLKFTKEIWMGRIRACRGVGAFLPEQAITDFDKANYKLLSEITKETFSILHEISIHVFEI